MPALVQQLGCRWEQSFCSAGTWNGIMDHWTIVLSGICNTWKCTDVIAAILQPCSQGPLSSSLLSRGRKREDPGNEDGNIGSHRFPWLPRLCQTSPTGLSENALWSGRRLGPVPTDHLIREVPVCAQKEGGVKICGDAVLRYFWRGLAKIFIPICVISVLLDYAVAVSRKFGSRLSMTVKYLRCYSLKSSPPLL